MSLTRSSAEHLSSDASSTSLRATGDRLGREYPDLIRSNSSDVFSFFIIEKFVYGPSELHPLFFSSHRVYHIRT